MKINLLDTHTVLWFLSGNDNLSNSARTRIEQKKAINFISIGSLWEMAIKISLNKLKLKFPFSDFKSILEDNGFIVLSIEMVDIEMVAKMPIHHRDPFDRIIISQAINN